MERVETLLKKLQEQFMQKAPPEQLLLTVQMLQAELVHLQAGNMTGYTNNDVSVTVSNIPPQVNQAPVHIMNTQPEEKTIETLVVNEDEIEAELEEIRRKAENIKKISLQNKPYMFLQEEEDIPTLTHQENHTPEKNKKEINESIAVNGASLNERLKQSRIDLGDTLTEVPIRDLRKAIGVNDRFLFINELFRGDEAAYERSIKTINSFSIFPEAEYWIQRELKVKNAWDDSEELVQEFYRLVKRRFS